MSAHKIPDVQIKRYLPMVSPDIDNEDKEFCYFNSPTDVIGMKDSKDAFQITPEGYIYSLNNGELVFFTGNPPKLINKRVKTLHKDYLPIIQYTYKKDGINYEITTFAFSLNGKPEENLLCFTSVKVINSGSETCVAYFGCGIRFLGYSNNPWGIADNRMSSYMGSIPREHYYKYYQDRYFETFDPQWKYSFEDSKVIRNDCISFAFSEENLQDKYITLFPFIQGYQPRNDRFELLPDTIAGAVLYSKQLKPQESYCIYLKMPAKPIPKDSLMVKGFEKAKFDDYFDRSVEFWEDILSKSATVEVTEEKVNNTFKASLIYDLIAREKSNNDFIQKVNKFQYNAFWLRDASFIIRGYDLLGLHNIAEESIYYFLKWQNEEGNFMSQGGQYDGWGQTLWAFGQHYKLTHDEKFAKRIFPAIKRAIEWFKNVRRKDIYGVMPETTPGDNEAITGHVTGHNFWAVTGLKCAIVMAKAIGEDKLAKEYEEELEDFLKAFMKRLDELMPLTKGYIPPGLEDGGGQDWGNMLGAFLSEVFDPFDERITKTQEVVRGKFREGLMTYFDGLFLHHYMTMRVTQTSLMRDEQEVVIRDLYNILVHTGSTHTGFETRLVPWCTRDFGFNMAPHGWFAADYIALIRNMLVREKGNELHLLSAISPEWLKEGEKIEVKNAPTDFGIISFKVKFNSDKINISIDADFHTLPKSIVIHIPYFINVEYVKSQTNAFVKENEAIVIPPTLKSVVIGYKKKKGYQHLSYKMMVEWFKNEWRRRYEHWRKTGETLPENNFQRVK